MSVFKIVPTTQQYDWGKVGKNSKVAHFAAAGLPGFQLDEKAPYAELWMGTHTSSPSKLTEDRGLLADHLKAHPELIGDRIIKRFDAANGNLPFLFKVLSIEKALSIQSHPDKRTAESLHAKQPNIYKDPNHKPEMALALTPFRALCGFRPLPEIANFLQLVPELASLIPATVLQTFLSAASSGNTDGPSKKIALKNIFAAVMTAPELEFKHQLRLLVSRYKGGGAKSSEGESQELVDLVLRLNSQFPGDIGVFCPFVLNYITLQPGEAIFLGAGEPHAYIYGECMECMANSDNVIRAGLTPKLRDVPNLVATLTYESSKASKHMVSPRPLGADSKFSTLYDPPIPEFSVIKADILAGEIEKHPKLDGPSIVIVTEGRGSIQWTGGEERDLELGVGEVFYVGAGAEISIRAGGTKCVVYRAFAED
ncbi:Mannose-6-phosphate isomerase [Leucoagaricus sp. SymC.cos]|nr:Mannose-6-phosphate isomerase [Leucoagaricus sp. SymC.cos]